MKNLPLDGIRVIDMATVLMGPVATQILGDYGADIIKIEPPEGDVMRHAGMARNPQMGPMYIATGRNKRSIALDAKRPEGLDAVLKLCTNADLFIHNIRPKAMKRLGLSYEDVRAVNPNIIYIALVGYGQDGPYAEKPAFDDIIQAASGLAGLFTMAGADAPSFVPANLCDRMTGLSAAHAALAALFLRARTGMGQAIEIPMYETLVQTVLGDHLNGEAFVPAIGAPGYNRLLNPYRKPFKTSDGYLALTPYNDKQYRKFFAAIDSEQEFDDDERINTHAARAKNYDIAYARLRDILPAKTNQEWIALCEANEIPCQPVRSISDLFEDEHLQQVGFFQEFDHPSEGRIRQMRIPARWSETEFGMRHLPPKVGADSLHILRDAGFAEAEIDALLSSGVLLQAGPPR